MVYETFKLKEMGMNHNKMLFSLLLNNICAFLNAEFNDKQLTNKQMMKENFNTRANNFVFCLTDTA
jgi:hypothetical protein